MYVLFYVAKTMALISCAVAVQLISAFVFALQKSLFSHEAARTLKKWFDEVNFQVNVSGARSSGFLLKKSGTMALKHLPNTCSWDKFGTVQDVFMEC